MAGNLSNYAENKVLDHIHGKTAFTMPTIYMALYTTAPTDSTSGTEVANSGSYARVAVPGASWNAASGGSISNAADINFTQATGSWGTVVAAALVDSGTHGAGNIIAYVPLTINKTIDSGDTFKIAIGDAIYTLD